MSVFIHQSAIVDDGVSIGEDTKIWHFCHVMNHCRIGARCTLGQNVFIGKGVVLGNDVKVQNNVSLFEGIHCEDEVFIGPSATFTNVSNPRSAVDRSGEFKNTLLSRGATVGANATVLCGLTIGKWAFIGAGSVILRDVPDHALYVGNPAKQMGWMSRQGHRLHFDEQGTAYCEEEDNIYIKEDGQVRLDEG